MRTPRPVQMFEFFLWSCMDFTGEFCRDFRGRGLCIMTEFSAIKKKKRKKWKTNGVNAEREFRILACGQTCQSGCRAAPSGGWWPRQRIWRSGQPGCSRWRWRRLLKDPGQQWNSHRDMLQYIEEVSHIGAVMIVEVMSTCHLYKLQLYIWLTVNQFSVCCSYSQGWSRTGCWGCWLRIQQQFELWSAGGMQCWASSHLESHYNHGHGGWCSWSPAPPGQQDQRRKKMMETELSHVTLYPTLVLVGILGG